MENHPTSGKDDWARSQEELVTELERLRRRVAELEPVLGEPEATATLAAIVESSQDAIISKTLDGSIRTWNAAAQRMFGYTPEEAIGKPIGIIIPADRLDEEKHILERLEAGERIDHYETVRLTKDGRQIDVSVTVSPVRDYSGRIVGASKIARDITAQKQFQAELEGAKQSAEAANHAKDQFLSVLSHELRTPLTPVLAEMSFIESQSSLPRELMDHIVMIRRNIETEARLVDDLLDLTRISRGKVILRFEIVNTHEALRSTVAMLQSQIDEKDLKITINMRAREHHVWADAGRLQQVFLSLLSNAVKFTPAGGSISVRTSNRSGSQIRIEIEDSGSGIDSNMMPHLFNAFEQGPGGRQLGGLGLGLSISKALIEMHKGTIKAKSRGKDLGATLTVELATIASTAQLSPETSATGFSPTMGLRILLVEDHADTRKIMQRLLQSSGCAVTAVSCAREAIAAAEEQTFDLLISDIGLPDGSGTDIIRYLKPRKHLRGIALSGYGQEEDLRRSREAGFNAHLTKPVNFTMLRETIMRIAV